MPAHVRPVLPVGPQWLHEVKHDGFRLMVRRTAQGVRIKTTGCTAWESCAISRCASAGKRGQ